MKYLFLLLFCSSAFAETLEIQQIDSAFSGGDYEKVELLSLRLLRSNTALLNGEKAHVNLTAGYALIMQNRESDAREYFYRALEAVPSLTLDPIEVSPKFRMVFDEVKQDFTKQETQKAIPSSKSLLTYKRTGPSKTALLTNAVLPGIGQWQEGQKIRGVCFFAATLGVGAWHISRLSQLHDSRRAYYSESDASLIKSKYKKYNQDYGLAWYSGIAAVGVFVAAQVDLILFSSPKTDNPLSSANPLDLRIECAGQGTAVTKLGLKLSF